VSERLTLSQGSIPLPEQIALSEQGVLLSVVYAHHHVRRNSLDLNSLSLSDLPATAPDFLCMDGRWVLVGNTVGVIIVVGPTPTVIIGNLTLPNGGVVTINGNGSLNVTGCVKLDGDLVVSLDDLGALNNSLLLHYGCYSGNFRRILINADNLKDCESVEARATYEEKGMRLSYAIIPCGT